MRSLHNSTKSPRWWPFAIIGLLVTLVYIPTFSGEFMLDDHALIENNPYIKEPHSLASYFDQEDGIVSNENRPEEHTGYYRPLANLTYRLDYKAWGMKPQGFRATNLLLHLLVSFSLYSFILLLVNDRQTAFWASLLYAIHPVNTEAVSWVCSRNNILVALFFLLSFYFYVKTLEGAGHLSFIASVLFSALAILSKEFGLLVLPCIFFYQKLLANKTRGVRQEIITYVPFFLIAIGYFFLRKMVIGSWVPPPGQIPLWERLYFVPYLMAWNFKLIFLPYGLHNFIVNYPSSYLHWNVLASFLVICFSAILIWKARKNRFLIFSVLSFCITLLPTLNIIHIPAVTLISMRWLYLPMVFVFLAAAQPIHKFLKTNHALTTSVLSLFVLYLGVHSCVLNSSLWHDEESFLRQEVVRFNNFFHAGGLAENLLDKKDYVHAERYFQMAIKNYPKVSKNYINYSALLVDTGRPEAAISVLNQAKSLPMTSKERAERYNNTGTAYFHLMDYEQALRYFKEAVDSWPGASQFWSNLGAAYGSLGDYTNSASALEKGLELASDSVQIRKDLAVVYCRMGHPARAISVLQRIPHEKLDEIGVKQLLDKALKEGSKGCENGRGVKP
jgi:tetratricopeptide (TPR) repeat protein